MVINPDTGDYIMGSNPDGDDNVDVSREARARFGTNRLFGIRVGYPAIAAIGATLTPYELLQGDTENVEEDL